MAATIGVTSAKQHVGKKGKVNSKNYLNVFYFKFTQTISRLVKSFYSDISNLGNMMTTTYCLYYHQLSNFVR